MTQTTEELLAQRQTTHGEYSEHARCTQAILRALEAERGWDDLPDIVRETCHMIAHKLGRVVTGHALVPDHWADIAGYSKLIEQRIQSEAPTRPGTLAPGHRPDDLWTRDEAPPPAPRPGWRQQTMAEIDATLDACEPSPEYLGHPAPAPSSGTSPGPSTDDPLVPRGRLSLEVGQTVYVERGPFAGKRAVIRSVHAADVRATIEGYDYSMWRGEGMMSGHRLLLSEIGHIV